MDAICGLLRRLVKLLQWPKILSSRSKVSHSFFNGWFLRVLSRSSGSFTYNPGCQNIRQRGGHVNILAYNKKRGVDRDLVVVLVSLPPRLLANDPNAGSHAWTRLGRLLSHDEFQARHCLETRFKGLTRLDVVVHGHVVRCLGHDDGVVGGALEEGRFGEVEEDCVGVEAAHLGYDLGGSPLDLVERRVVWIRHFETGSVGVDVAGERR